MRRSLWPHRQQASGDGCALPTCSTGVLAARCVRVAKWLCCRLQRAQLGLPCGDSGSIQQRYTLKPRQCTGYAMRRNVEVQRPPFRFEVPDAVWLFGTRGGAESLAKDPASRRLLSYCRGAPVVLGAWHSGGDMPQHRYSATGTWLEVGGGTAVLPARSGGAPSQSTVPTDITVFQCGRVYPVRPRIVCFSPPLPAHHHYVSAWPNPWFFDCAIECVGTSSSLASSVLCASRLPFHSGMLTKQGKTPSLM